MDPRAEDRVQRRVQRTLGDAYRDVFHHSSENPLLKTANVLELRRGPPKTRKLPQSIQSPEGVDLIPSRDGRIRTGDPLNPIQVRYRAAPRPVREGI